MPDLHLLCGKLADKCRFAGPGGAHDGDQFGPLWYVFGEGLPRGIPDAVLFAVRRRDGVDNVIHLQSRAAVGRGETGPSTWERIVGGLWGDRRGRREEAI